MERIKGFDGLRALAVSVVFLQHYTSLGRDIELGSYGVWLFFALSGFLIVRILHAERLGVEARRTTLPDALGRFLWRRCLRIVPIYYLALGVFTALAALHWVGDFPLADAGWHYGFASNVYFGEVVGQWSGRFTPLWSLAIEQQFYLLAAPLLLLAPAAWARPICGLVALCALAQNALLWTGGAEPIAVFTNSAVNFGAIGIGGLAGLATPARPRAGASGWLPPICFAAAAATCALMLGIGEQPRQAWVLLGAAPMIVTAAAASLALVSIHRNQASRLVRALEWGPIAGFGRISYGFYLYHNLPPHWLLTGLARRMGYDWQAPENLEALVSFVLALGLAAASWRFIERPLMRLKGQPELAKALAGRAKALLGRRPLPARA